MRCLLLLFVTLAVDGAFAADQEIAQVMLTEIRALRLELRNTAATIQRVQIVMYRLQAQTFVVDRASQRVDMARSQCRGAEEQQKQTAKQIELMRKQAPQNGAEQKGVEQMISKMETWTSRAQE